MTSFQTSPRRVRFVNFDGTNLHFFDMMDPTAQETLPVHPNCHAVAVQLQQQNAAAPFRLCQATVVNGEIIDLVPTARRNP